MVYGVKENLQKSMDEESEASALYKNRALNARINGDEVSAKLWEHIADEEDGHYNEFKDRLVTISEDRAVAQKLTKGLLEAKSGVYVTVTSQGDTTLNVGDVICAEAFDAENERVRAFHGKEATGEYHY